MAQRNVKECISHFLISASALVSLGCAGPTNPFGHYGVFPSVEEIITRVPASNEFKVSPVAISFSPKKQNFHQTKTFSVHIHDPQGVGPLSTYNLFYNKRNITNLWLNNAKVTKDKFNLHLKFTGLRLPATKDHDIVLQYQRGISQQFITASYEQPECTLSALDPLGKLEPFAKRKTKFYAPLIEDLGVQEGINPSFIAGLIAQESAFNTKAVSYAKAIGLTQVTQGAASEISQNFQDFPMYEGIDSLPVPLLRSLIMAGKINHRNEWRLHPRYSILGGIHYLKRLEDYWYRKETQKLIYKVYPNDADNRIDDLILASYNSGPFRVKRSLRRRGKDWLNAKELKEAKKYVKKVKSYCYHFASQHQ